MTQEEKQLLLKELCARLPYGVMCKLSAKGANVSITENLETGGLGHFIFDTMDVLPYLRAMSSMTEKERNEYFDFRNQELQRVVFAEVGRESAIAEISDWLNSHHFDFRGLIEKGLALEAPPEMYKTD